MMKFDNMINSNNFNAFELHKETKMNSLYFMLQYVSKKFNFELKLDMDPKKYMKFSQKLQTAYREVPYHTSVHAADVVQNVYYYLNSGGAKDICQANPLDLAGLLISSAAHDVDHPGNNNVFETKTKSKLATLYND